MRGLMAALILVAFLWAVSGFVRRFQQGRSGAAEKGLARPAE